MQTSLIYLVEGQTEKKLIETLKSELRCIKSGRVSVVNVVQEHVKRTLFASLLGTITTVLLFDTDNNGEATLKENIRLISSFHNVREVICIPQVRNLEEELRYSCGLRDLRKLTNSRTYSDVKRDLLRITNLDMRLKQCGFDIVKLWARQLHGGFAGVKNGASRVKLLR